jgi:hypothetical protein
MENNMPEKKLKSKVEEFIVPQDYINPLEDISDLPIGTAKKMKKNVYFRIKNGKDFDPLTLMTLSDPRSMEEQAYIVLPTIIDQLAELADQITTSSCYLAITRAGEKKILHTPAITDINKSSAVLVARAKIFEEAKFRWLRMTWDADVRLHRAIYPKYEIPEPEWGDLPPLIEIIFQAFDGRVIESADHELVAYLLGGSK